MKIKIVNSHIETKQYYWIGKIQVVKDQIVLYTFDFEFFADFAHMDETKLGRIIRKKYNLSKQSEINILVKEITEVKYSMSIDEFLMTSIKDETPISFEGDDNNE